MTKSEHNGSMTDEPRRRLRRAARALLVTPDQHLLLMSMAFPWLEAAVWIAPGGGLRAAESWEAAVIRELQEETGLLVHTAGHPVWERSLDINHEQKVTRLHERYFLFHTARFEPTHLRQEPLERTWFREFRWWPLAAIADDDSVEVGATLRDVISRSL